MIEAAEIPEWKIVSNQDGKLFQNAGATTGMMPNARATATITMFWLFV